MQAPPTETVVAAAAEAIELAAPPARRIAGTWVEKVLIAFGLAIFCSVGFFGLAKMNAAHAASGKPYVNLETWVDRFIAFDPRWIWIYLSYYLGTFVPIIAWRRTPLFRQIAAGYALEFGICFVLFSVLPARMAQPAVPDGGWSEWAVQRLFYHDQGFNIFPSLHVANALFVAAACARISRGFGRVMWVWAALIGVSTMAVKQHYFVDVVAGVALALGAIWAVFVRWDGLLPSERAPCAAPA